jgi:hypothetical protein
MQTTRALASQQRNMLRNKMSLIPTLMTQGMTLPLQRARFFSAIRCAIPAFRLIRPLDRRRQPALVRASMWTSAVARLIKIHK